MQTPFASELSADPAGDRIAWVLFEQGKRNIYLAAAPDWKARKATSFNEDDGQEIDQIAWSRDGSALFFTRGGDFEMERDVPNPALSVTKPDQSIWILRMNGAAPQKLVEGSAAETCQGNSGIVYLKAGQIWEAQADGGGAYAGGAVTVNGALFRNNTASAGNGGGLWASSASVLSGTQFVSNTASGATYASGGGLYVTTTLSLTGAQFVGNAANYGGGAHANGATTLNGGLFQNNAATWNGGGLERVHSSVLAPSPQGLLGAFLPISRA